jgi:hypothetical protein
VVDNRLRHNGTKPRHPVGEPTWNVTPVQRQIGATSPSCHPSTIPTALSSS